MVCTQKIKGRGAKKIGFTALFGNSMFDKIRTHYFYSLSHDYLCLSFDYELSYEYQGVPFRQILNRILYTRTTMVVSRI
jgi:hypothetical protein